MKNIIRFLCLLSLALGMTGYANKAYGVGATTPFTSVEAESGTLANGATIVSLTSPPTTEFSSPQLEASGHSYVHLSALNHSVTLTNNTGHSITAINIRYSIPDSSGGGGITSTLDLYVNGTMRQVVNVNSKQTWVYENTGNYNGMSQTPSSGSAHVFWDETHFFITGAAVANGSTITLKKDSTNTATYYDIDVVDLEAPPAALTQPANSLSITSSPYNAVANNSGVDNTTAIQNCVNDAQTQGKSVWIPSGTFYLNSGTSISATGVTIAGAGPWYSTIYETFSSSGSGWVFLGVGASFQNLCIDDSGTVSTGNQMDAVLGYGDNWTMNNVWASHTMLTWGTGNNITIQNCRVNNSWGDGLNINNDNGTSCTNVTIQNNFVRGNGDDGIAVNSSDPTAPIMDNITVSNNTSVASWWANQIGVYGGSRVSILNNLLVDSVKNTGLNLTAYGGGTTGGHGADLTSATVQGNTILRGGSLGYGQQMPAMSLGYDLNQHNPDSEANILVSGNTLTNPMFAGVALNSNTNMVFQGNTINHPGTQGFTVASNAIGNGVFNTNQLLNLNAGQTAFQDSVPYSTYMTGGISNTGFAQGPYTLPAGWTSGDIGSVGASGGACYNSPTFTIVGSGADIWNTADAFQYVSQTASGNTTITARVNTEEIQVSGWSKAGVMIRETTASNSANAAVLVTPSNGVVMQWRTTTGGSCTNIDITGKTAPLWVRMVRNGSTFTGYYSTNGSSWTSIGSTTISMSSSATAGLAITSQSSGTLCSAMLDNVSKTNP